MSDRNEGGIAVSLLGMALLVLLIVGGLGLVESARSMAFRTHVTRALDAALLGASVSEPDRAELFFQHVLAINLHGADYAATLEHTATGLQAHIKIAYQLQFLGFDLPPIPMRLVHTANQKP